MDGTIYRGRTLFDFTNPFLRLVRELGLGCTFLTNNSSKSARDYLKHLRRMGIPATAEQIYTSTMATIDFLRDQATVPDRLFVLGTPSMQQELVSAGFSLTGDDADEEPDAVVVGFDTGLTFARLCRAAYWIEQGKPFIATHPDRVCPTDEPTVLVDCGAVCAALTAATGREPDAVLGKPDARMLRGVLAHHGLAADQLAMVGDRLYTDVAMGQRAGALSVLVLSGEATAADAAAYRPRPDLVVQNLAQFGEQLREVHA